VINQLAAATANFSKCRADQEKKEKKRLLINNRASSNHCTQ